MSTQQNMPTPKNYITAGISKSLLTPCRRVGLSRTKKTPNHVNASPLARIPNIPAVQTTPGKTVEQICRLDKTNVKASKVEKTNFDCNETPKTVPTPKKPENKTITKVALDTVSNSKNKVQEVTSAKLGSDQVSIRPDDSNTPSDTNKKNSENNYFVEDGPNQSSAVKTVVVAEIHHPVARKSINFDIIDKSPILAPITSNEKDKKKVGQHTQNNSSVIMERDILCPNQTKENFKENNNCKVATKRKLRLDSDDFTSDLVKNENVSGQKTSPKSKVVKINHTKENSNAITLDRFTTEDYLKEYSSDPQKFEENLGKDSLSIAIIQGIEDMNTFSSFTNNTDMSKIKSQTINAAKNSHKNEKNCVPILCPSIDKIDMKVKRSLSIKKPSNNLQNHSEKVTTSELSTKPILTVSLDRLTTKNLTNNFKGNDEVQLEELPFTPKLITSNTKKTCLTINEDEELFTSSPENDKNQRESLLQLISKAENEIKQKQEKLVKLKQAQVYKKKHSPEKLKVSSERWLEGCRTGLKDLLVKMQEHGPIDMEMLVRKLRISDNIVEMLKF